MTLFLNSNVVNAGSGVGISTGKIILDNPLEPVTVHSLPSVAVYNTGDEPAEYEMDVTLNESQSQYKPESTWVEFLPKRFILNGGESKLVNISINIPENAQQGDYYAYLEAHTTKSSTNTNNNSNVSSASAVKFYFKVVNPIAESDVVGNAAVDVDKTLNISHWYSDDNIFKSVFRAFLFYHESGTRA